MGYATPNFCGREMAYIKEERKTAPYRIISDAGGRRYRFYCERSGMAVCMTMPIRADTRQEELRIAWEGEGRKHFNRCHNCGKWVSDVMYNVDTMECVDCSPWEEPPLFCPKCGIQTSQAHLYCQSCGAKLLYAKNDCI